MLLSVLQRVLPNPGLLGLFEPRRMLQGRRRNQNVVEESERDVDALAAAAADFAGDDIADHRSEHDVPEVDLGVGGAVAGQDYGVAQLDDVLEGDAEADV